MWDEWKEKKYAKLVRVREKTKLEGVKQFQTERRKEEAAAVDSEKHLNHKQKWKAHYCAVTTILSLEERKKEEWRHKEPPFSSLQQQQQEEEEEVKCVSIRGNLTPVYTGRFWLINTFSLVSEPTFYSSTLDIEKHQQSETRAH